MQFLEAHCNLLDNITPFTNSPGDVYTLEFENHDSRVLVLKFVSTFNYLEGWKGNTDCKYPVLRSGVRLYLKIGWSSGDCQAAAFESHCCSEAAFRGIYCGPEPSMAVSPPTWYQLGSGPNILCVFKGSILASFKSQKNIMCTFFFKCWDQAQGLTCTDRIL